MKLQFLKHIFYKILFITLLSLVIFSIYFVYTSDLQYYNQSSTNSISNLTNNSKQIKFDVEGNDTLVFLHIQKTGGTQIERALTKEGLRHWKCKCFKGEKRCDCRNKSGINWLFSRYSTGWRCGLHADWTELSSCITLFLKTEANNLKYFGMVRRIYFFTMLRNPIERYLSEWKHVQRGATWWQSRHLCNGRSPSIEELPPCYNDFDWSDVSLSEFLRCKSNLSNNRQTRMLADLNHIGCYNLSWPKRNNLMLSNAIHNLLQFSFFGLLEYITMTQYLFHKTFTLILKEILQPLNVTHSTLIQLSKNEIKEISDINNLDIEFYNLAEAVFLERVMINLVQDKIRIYHCCHYLFDIIDWNLLEERNINYFKKKNTTINKIIIQLLYMDGSRFASKDILNVRQQKWNKKLKLEMETEFE